MKLIHSHTPFNLFLISLHLHSLSAHGSASHELDPNKDFLSAHMDSEHHIQVSHLLLDLTFITPHQAIVFLFSRDLIWLQLFIYMILIEIIS